MIIEDIKMIIEDIKIKKYWDNQVKLHGINANVSTQDIWMRQIEIKYITNFLDSIDGSKKVLDIGCGNGFSIIQYKKKVPRHKYTGGDYSINMINAAKELRYKSNFTENDINFEIMDVMNLSNINKKYDIIISDRCLINLQNALNRKKALEEIAKCLNVSGKYLMIENFIEGQNELNKLRQHVGLDKILIKWHNSFFTKEELLNSIKHIFHIEHNENISSPYYLITRVIYSKICELKEVKPDYNDIINDVSALLPPMGNVGPINAYVMSKLK